jgi:hypothetical protein
MRGIIQDVKNGIMKKTLVFFLVFFGTLFNDSVAYDDRFMCCDMKWVKRYV